MENKKAVIYARFSPRRNEEQCESIEMQLEAIKDYCQKNNIEIVEEFSDRALSGGEEDRPGLWAAVAALKRDYLLIVYKLDRLARDVYLSHIIEKDVKKHKSKILSINDEGTFGDKPEDKLIRDILQSLAEYERKITAARTKAAMLRHQKNGKRMSYHCPFGTMPSRRDPTRLVPNPDEQAAIAHIIECDKAGLSLRKICKSLVEHSYKTRFYEREFKDRKVRVRAKWSTYLVRNILRRAKAC